MAFLVPIGYMVAAAFGSAYLSKIIVFSLIFDQNT
jgi:hypothetical protein